MYYIVGIAPVVSAEQKKSQSIRRENDTHLGTGSIYPITVSSASESSTVASSIYTIESNNSPSTGGHELLVDRSPQEQHDYKQQGSSIILCLTFSPNVKNTLN